MEEATAQHEVFWWCFDMQNSSASGHPLGIAICDRATTAVIIEVIEDSIDDVGDCLKTTMWMPWSSLWFTGCVFHFAHLIQMNEGI